MNLFILGICGTFMGSLAMLAREAGHSVRGCDQAVYPPMSTQLQEAGIELLEGYEPAWLDPAPDVVIVGNAMSRGNPMVEYLLNEGLHYQSGPQWLSENVLRGRWVLAVSGTHGKTSTASMLAWILDQAGQAPGFLIGGVPRDFDCSARLGAGRCFVVEADEYDTAFFDKRSKFVHYQPRTLILNNLEFDHADIFADLAAIQRQFHHLLRIVPQNGRVIAPAGVPAIEQVLELGCWTPVERMSLDGDADWQARAEEDDGSVFEVSGPGHEPATVHWTLSGLHNVANGLAAIAAAAHAGVAPERAAQALAHFGGVKRRLEVLGEIDGVTVYDDFAHHPTAIRSTLNGLRARLGDSADIIAVLEPRSNTMRMGIHREHLGDACEAANAVLWYRAPGIDWDVDAAAEMGRTPARVLDDTDSIIEYLCKRAQAGSHVLVMSNGGFEGLHQRLLAALAERSAA